MTQTHLHLLINHLPLIGSLLGALVLIHGIGTKSEQTKIAAYYIFILSAIGATIAYFTGEAAEESVKNIQGVLETNIEQHEDIAIFALISLSLLGLISIIGTYSIYAKMFWSNAFAYLILVLSILSFALAARTGFLGGQIRHTELHSTQNTSVVPNANEDD